MQTYITDLIDTSALPEVPAQARTNAESMGQLAAELGDACGIRSIHLMLESELHMVSASLVRLRQEPDSSWAAGAIQAYEHEAHALQRMLLMVTAWNAGRKAGA